MTDRLRYWPIGMQDTPLARDLSKRRRRERAAQGGGRSGAKGSTGRAGEGIAPLCKPPLRKRGRVLVVHFADEQEGAS